MKEKFSEYYQLEEAELKEFWRNDIFCFDANVLLNLYRYTPKTRDAFFNLFEQIKERIWITHQAAFQAFYFRRKRNQPKLIGNDGNGFSFDRHLL